MRKTRFGQDVAMQAAQDYASVKAQLEERVAGLKRQREAAMKEVESLSLRVAIKELEKQAKALEGELGTLNERRSQLEQKLAALDSPAVQATPQQPRPAARQAIAQQPTA